jgi:hypothetical protein
MIDERREAVSQPHVLGILPEEEARGIQRGIFRYDLVRDLRDATAAMAGALPARGPAAGIAGGRAFAAVGGARPRCRRRLEGAVRLSAL